MIAALTALLLIGALAALTAGVHIIAGIGWALIVVAVPLFVAGAVLLRGLTRG